MERTPVSSSNQPAAGGSSKAQPNKPEGPLAEASQSVEQPSPSRPPAVSLFAATGRTLLKAAEAPKNGVSEEQPMDVVGNLPSEIGLIILGNLPPKDLAVASAVSHHWRVLAQDWSLNEVASRKKLSTVDVVTASKLAMAAQKIADNGQAWWPNSWPIGKMPYTAVRLLPNLFKETQTLQLILDGKPDQADSTSGATPLHLASRQGHLDVTRTLLAAGANIDQGDSQGQTPLFIASRYNRFDATRMLLAAGANIDQGDSQGQTPLHVAISHGRSDIASELLAKGANLDLKDSVGRTALDLARKYNRTDIIALLQQTKSRYGKGENYQFTLEPLPDIRTV